MLENFYVKAWDSSSHKILNDSYFKQLGSVCLEIVPLDEIKNGVMIYEGTNLDYMVSLGQRDSLDNLIYGGDILKVINGTEENTKEMSLDIYTYAKECELIKSLIDDGVIKFEVVGNIFNEKLKSLLN